MGFLKKALLLFVAFRAGDLVNLAAGMWFVPKYVKPEDIGAVLPLSSFATFLSLPIFAFAMTVMKESSVLAANGERGKIKSLLRGVFVAVGIATLLVLAATALIMPRFAGAMGIKGGALFFLVVAAAFLGCVAPVWTDALQSLKRFGTLAFAESAGSVFRFVVMLAVMPFKALQGYFAGQAALPVFRILVSVIALRRDLRVLAEPFWNRQNARRMALFFVGVLVYQAIPMGVSLIEYSALRLALPAENSAGYFMITRFSDFLYYLTFPLLLVAFPYTATAAERGESTHPYVTKCSAITLAAALLMMVVYALSGSRLLALLPNGADYLMYAKYMPYMVIITALTSCQVFYTNAEVSAGRFGFLFWFVPLHLLYVIGLSFAVKTGIVNSLDGFIVCFAVIALLRFLFGLFNLSQAKVKFAKRRSLAKAS